MSLSPICTINGSPTPTDVGASSTVNGALVNAAGVLAFFISAIGADEVIGPAGLATINASLVINQTNKTFSYSQPAGLGSAVIFMVTVGVSPLSQLGAGRDVNGQIVPAWTTTFKVNVPTATGGRVIASGEVLEQNSAAGWNAVVNPGLRSAGAGGTGSGTTKTTGSFTQPAVNAAISGVGILDPTAIVQNRTYTVGGNGNYVLTSATGVSPATLFNLGGNNSPAPGATVSSGAVVAPGGSGLPVAASAQLAGQGRVNIGGVDTPMRGSVPLFFTDLANTSPNASNRHSLQLDGYATTGDLGGGPFDWKVDPTLFADGGTAAYVTGLVTNLPGTFAVTNGSTAVTASVTQVGGGMVAGSLVTFASQPGVQYSCTFVGAAVTLLTKYTGTTNAATAGTQPAGGWVRRQKDECFYVTDFGAIPNTTTPFATSAIQNAINAAARRATTAASVPPVMFTCPSASNAIFFIDKPIILKTNSLSIDGSNGATAQALAGMRAQYVGPCLIAAPDLSYLSSQLPPIVQDGATAFYGLTMGPAQKNYNIDLSMGGPVAQLNGLAGLNLEGWFSFASGLSGTIVDSQGSEAISDPGTNSFQLGLSGGFLYARLSTSVSAYNAGSIATTGYRVQSSIAWPNLTRTAWSIDYDGSTLRLYQGGTLVGSVAATGTVAQGGNEDFLIGGSNQGTLLAGPLVCSAAGCPNGVLYGMRMTRASRYTVGTYTPPTAPFTSADCDVNTSITLNFAPSFIDDSGIGLMHGYYQNLGLGFGPTATFLVMWNDTIGQAQLAGPRIRNIVTQAAAGHGLLCIACPNTRLDNIMSVGGDAAVTLVNNCYGSQIDNLKCQPASVRGGHNWGLGMLQTSGVSSLKHVQITGGQYTYVNSNASAYHEHFYTIAGGKSNFLIKNAGQQGNYTFKDCYPGDEGGSQSGPCLIISGIFSTFTWEGGNIQRLVSPGPLVLVDVPVLGNLVFNTSNFQGVATSPTFSFPYGNPGKPVVVTASTYNTGFSGGVTPPWVDVANPGHVIILDSLLAGVARPNFAANAPLAVKVNDYFSGKIIVTDTGKLLAGATDVSLPFYDNGERRTIFNETLQSFTVNKGAALAAGNSADFACIDSVWQKVSANNPITAFRPELLPNLVFDLNADTTTPAGGTVPSMTDDSGNGFNAVQAVVGNQPAYLASSTHLNSQKSISYNGTTNQLAIPNAAGLQLTGDFTFATVVYSTAATMLLVSKGNGSGGAAGEYFILASPGPNLYRNSIAYTGASFNIPQNTPTAIVMTQRSGRVMVATNTQPLIQIGALVPTVPTTTNSVKFGLDSGAFPLTGEQPRNILYSDGKGQTDVYSLLVFLSQKYGAIMTY